MQHCCMTVTMSTDSCMNVRPPLLSLAFCAHLDHPIFFCLFNCISLPTYPCLHPHYNSTGYFSSACTLRHWPAFPGFIYRIPFWFLKGPSLSLVTLLLLLHLQHSLGLFLILPVSDISCLLLVLLTFFEVYLHFQYS